MSALSKYVPQDKFNFFLATGVYVLAGQEQPIHSINEWFKEWFKELDGYLDDLIEFIKVFDKREHVKCVYCIAKGNYVRIILLHNCSNFLDIHVSKPPLIDFGMEMARKYEILGYVEELTEPLGLGGEDRYDGIKHGFKLEF